MMQENFEGIPIEECTEGSFLNKKSVFLLVWGLGFAGIPSFCVMDMITSNNYGTINGEPAKPSAAIGFLAIFIIIGVVVIIFGFIKPLVATILVSSKGEIVDGTLVDWEFDNTTYNDQPLTCMLIKIHTMEGDKVIRYQTGNISYNIPVGTKMQLKIFGNMVGNVKLIDY